jgi:hypothetical protein
MDSHLLVHAAVINHRHLLCTNKECGRQYPPAQSTLVGAHIRLMFRSSSYLPESGRRLNCAGWQRGWRLLQEVTSQRVTQCPVMLMCLISAVIMMACRSNGTWTQGVEWQVPFLDCKLLNRLACCRTLCCRLCGSALTTQRCPSPTQHQKTPAVLASGIYANLSVTI